MQIPNQFPPPPYFPIPFPPPPIAPSNVLTAPSAPASDLSAAITLMMNAVTQGNSNRTAITDALQRTTMQFADALQQTIQMGVDAQAQEIKNAFLRVHLGLLVCYLLTAISQSFGHQVHQAVFSTNSLQVLSQTKSRTVLMLEFSK